jgi:hypothetical protein
MLLIQPVDIDVLAVHIHAFHFQVQNGHAGPACLAAFQTTAEMVHTTWTVVDFHDMFLVLNSCTHKKIATAPVHTSERLTCRLELRTAPS